MQHCPACGTCYPETVRFCLLDATPLATVPPAPPRDAVRVVAARFQIEEQIHDTPLGPLHEAVDLARDELVWLRLVPARHIPSPTLAERALRELRPLATLQRDRPRGLPWVLGSGRYDGGLYCVFAAPPPGARALFEALPGPAPLEPARNVIRRVGEALINAQQLGLLHRNLAPYTVFVQPDGEVLVTDFGLCECHEQHFRIIQGSPAFLAPEQVLGRSITEAASVYTLAALYYTLLTGLAPSGEGDLASLIRRGPPAPPPPGELRRGVPDAVDRLLRRALDADPTVRPPTLARFVEEVAASEALSVSVPADLGGDLLGAAPGEDDGALPEPQDALNQPMSLHLLPTKPLPWPRPPVDATQD